MPTNFNHRFLSLIFGCLVFTTSTDTLDAAELQIDPTENDAAYSYILKLDRIEKLAGVKLVINYPKDQLHFASARKGKTFNSFMHIVNDKIPGKIIVVMASAKGVSGSNLPLLTLNFSRIHSNALADNQSINPVQCQLMSEDLQEISCTTPQQAKGNSRH
ncbi:cohesin domain-containing protein [Desulforhopalus sp. 52FAK]